MKLILIALSIAVASCSSLTPEQQAKAAAIANLALSYAEARGKITPSDAALVREVGTIVVKAPVETSSK